MDKTLRLCLVDMNNGHVNQAMRCFRVLVDSFFALVQQTNPGLRTELVVVQPRNLKEMPPGDCDLYLSSGGPDSPYDHDGEPWLQDLFGFYDGIVEKNRQGDPGAPSLFGVCYTFELLVRHFRVCAMVPRATRKFGVMPAYTTAEGLAHPLMVPFADRLFAFEHRTWEAIDLDEARLAELGGTVLARESRDGESKGRGILALDLAPGIECTQFHPEADRQGVIVWVSKREQAQAFVDTYGLVTYDRMLRTLDNPERIAKTFTLFIPGWLARKFNALALHHGWQPLPQPHIDMDLFEGNAPTAASVRFHSLVPTLLEPSLPDVDDEPRAAELDLDLVTVRKTTIAQNVAQLAVFGSDLTRLLGNRGPAESISSPYARGAVSARFCPRGAAAARQEERAPACSSRRQKWALPFLPPPRSRRTSRWWITCSPKPSSVTTGTCICGRGEAPPPRAPVSWSTGRSSISRKRTPPAPAG